MSIYLRICFVNVIFCRSFSLSSWSDSASYVKWIFLFHSLSVCFSLIEEWGGNTFFLPFFFSVLEYWKENKKKLMRWQRWCSSLLHSISSFKIYLKQTLMSFDDKVFQTQIIFEESTLLFIVRSRRKHKHCWSIVVILSSTKNNNVKEFLS